MRITDVETMILRRPDVRDIGDSSQDILLVRVLTDEGLVGTADAQAAQLQVPHIEVVQQHPSSAALSGGRCIEPRCSTAAPAPPFRP